MLRCNRLGITGEDFIMCAHTNDLGSAELATRQVAANDPALEVSHVLRFHHPPNAPCNASSYATPMQPAMQPPMETRLWNLHTRSPTIEAGKYYWVTRPCLLFLGPFGHETWLRF